MLCLHYCLAVIPTWGIVFLVILKARNKLIVLCRTDAMQPKLKNISLSVNSLIEAVLEKFDGTSINKIYHIFLELVFAICQIIVCLWKITRLVAEILFLCPLAHKLQECITGPINYLMEKLTLVIFFIKNIKDYKNSFYLIFCFLNLLNSLVEFFSELAILFIGPTIQRECIVSVDPDKADISNVVEIQSISEVLQGPDGKNNSIISINEDEEPAEIINGYDSDVSDLGFAD
jgi:hypothetical protein